LHQHWNIEGTLLVNKQEQTDFKEVRIRAIYQRKRKNATEYAVRKTTVLELLYLNNYWAILGENLSEMSRLILEILAADDWVSYLVVTERAGSQVEVLHCLRQYSAGFTASTTLHGRCLGFLGEM
jgi:hypothetical protein